ncbi:MAG: C_GCAxxG_C_C family protein [Dehalococcoidia bacterium]|nr:C_GCAxxG_C_C family protein [Dehalococcoidia bacterium]
MVERAVPDYEALKARVRELAKGPTGRAAIEAKLRKLSQDGIPKKVLNPDEIIAHKEEILERVQRRAEEYEQVSQSCAKSAALAVMEEFGLGNIKTITALSAFPGIALTGETCGAVSGGLIALSSYFGRDDLLDLAANARAYGRSRKFISLFEKEIGTTKCHDIHKDVIFGQHYDVSDAKEGYPAFVKDKGFEKCALPPGIGARLAAQIIIEDMERAKKS